MSAPHRIGLGLPFCLLLLLAPADHAQTQGPDTYRLPFPAVPKRKLVQGNNGPYGHTGHAQYAFDFLMPLDSPVLAARVGRVVAIEAKYANGTRVPGEENFVMIQHADSTFGRYYHLAQGGVHVSVGQIVSAGDTIGRSGDSGASAGPHLHFDVTRSCRDWGCQTIPVHFANAGADSLIAGHSYPEPQ